MCPVVLLALGLSFLLFLLEVVAALSVAFSPARIQKLKEGDVTEVGFSLQTKSLSAERFYSAVSENPDIASVLHLHTNYSALPENGYVNGTFSVRGNFLGHTRIRLEERIGNGTSQVSKEFLPTSVIRKQSILSLVFMVSVAILVSLNYINMGCALDLETVKSVMKRPIGPVVGFFSQYLAMPLIAYGLAKFLFKEPYLQLGLFTFGCSPGGGASNMWTVLLGGNLNLSVAMTFISTIAALGTMPMWLFTLGRSLFEDASVRVPFGNIFTTLISMTIPLAIGLLLQRFRPKVASFCRRILAPVSVAMILYIVAFGTYANLYMFSLFSWRVMLAAAATVWSGFLVGAVASRICGLPWTDVLAVSIETGVQNTGIAIVLLGFSLPQPESDIASVVPVAASLVTPVPLIFVAIGRKVYTRCCGDKEAAKRKNTHQVGVPDPEKCTLTESATPSANGSIAAAEKLIPDYGDGPDKF
uniref:Putative sodium-bile acid cotransporter n=1 Tax=Ornithodoros turicata TaxID=34597 RepID=A0A2R5LBU5_9ACAR